jgi:hypothetical protein
MSVVSTKKVHLCHFRLVRRLVITISIASIVGIVFSGNCAAFPLDPVRIFVQDTSPESGQFEAEVSVWSGGEPNAFDAGRRVYLEKLQVTTESDGHFDFWLGNGTKLEGELRGNDFSLDQKLRLQLRYIPSGAKESLQKRFVLSPIDNAYVAGEGTAQNQPKSRQPEQPRFFKTYDPKFDEFAPELVRRGIATLYPDGRLQTEDGSYTEIKATSTSGVQEFFDYCTDHHVDGYIIGGSIPRSQQVVYKISKPVVIHPAQGIRIDTGAITLQFMPALGDAPGLTIDSCMMNDIRIRGLLHYMAKGYALSIKPANPLPLDKFVGNTIVDTIVYVTSIACRDAKGAIEFDGSTNFSRFEFNEINHGGIGVHVTKESSFSNNRFTCKHVHGQTGVSVLDESGADNVWEVNVNCDAMDPLGIVTAGRDSIWFSNINSQSKSGLTLLPPAQGNQFFLMGLNGGYDNQAALPTNRFYVSPGSVPSKLMLGFAADTPPIPASGTSTINRSPFPVVVMVKSPGSVSNWELIDSHGETEKFTGTFQTGQNIYLGTGEGIRLHYDGSQPAWRWRAVQ